jgi:hypothetical protein
MVALLANLISNLPKLTPDTVLFFRVPFIMVCEHSPISVPLSLISTYSQISLPYIVRQIIHAVSSTRIARHTLT